MMWNYLEFLHGQLTEAEMNIGQTLRETERCKLNLLSAL